MTIHFDTLRMGIKVVVTLWLLSLNDCPANDEFVLDRDNIVVTKCVRISPGTYIVSGKPLVRIHDEERQVRARIEQIHGLSAHADQRELLRWIGNLKTPPREVFLAHGDDDQSSALASRIQSDFGWKATVADYDKTYELE